MSFSQNSNTSYHARSISLPSRSHPLLPEFKDHLRRLRSSESTSTSSQSTCLCRRIRDVKDLLDHVEALLLPQSNQQTLSNDQGKKCVDDLLDGSLKLLDACGASKDAFLQIKECIQIIQSSFRRRGSGELTFANEVVEYMSCRRKVKKTIKRSLKEIRSMIEQGSKNNEDVGILSLLKESETVTAEIFESLLFFIAGPKIQGKKSGWSVVSKLFHQTPVTSGDDASPANSFEDVDVALSSMLSESKKCGINVVKAKNLTSKMVELESEIQPLDEVLECLFRRLVKTRATLLNF